MAFEALEDDPRKRKKRKKQREVGISYVQRLLADTNPDLAVRRGGEGGGGGGDGEGGGGDDD